MVSRVARNQEFLPKKFRSLEITISWWNIFLWKQCSKISRWQWTSSYSQMVFKLGVLKNFAKFTGKHTCWSLFLIKLAFNFIKKRLQHRCFPVKFADFFRTAFFIEHLRWLLLISLSARKLLQYIVTHFAVFYQPVKRYQVFSIFKHVHESRHQNNK